MVATAAFAKVLAMPNNLQHLRRRARLTQGQIAERLGVSTPQVSRWETGKDGIPSARLASLAEAYGASIGALFDDGAVFAAIGPTLYVKGEVAAGVWREAFEWPEGEWLSFSGRADLDLDPQHRFGLRVRGESMNLVYPHGTIVECAQIGLGVALEPGRRVVVVREDEGGCLEATVKEYVARDGINWLWPRSSHPDFQQPWNLEEPGEGIVRISVVGIVVASIRPE